MLFGILAVCLGVFRSVMLDGNRYIDTLGLYTNSAIGKAFGVFVFVLVLATALLAIPLVKCENIDFKQGKRHGVVIPAVCAVATTALLISSATELFKGSAVVMLPHGGLNVVPAVLLAVEAVLYIPTAVFFVGMAFGKAKLGMLSLCTASAYGLRAIRLFMDTQSQINASQRSFMLAFLAVTMLFFVSEAEFFVPLGKLEKEGKAKSKRYAKYFVLGVIAVELAVIFVLTGLVFVSIPSGDVSAVMYGVFDLAMAVYAAKCVFTVKI